MLRLDLILLCCLRTALNSAPRLLIIRSLTSNCTCDGCSALPVT